MQKEKQDKGREKPSSFELGNPVILLALISIAGLILSWKLLGMAGFRTVLFWLLLYVAQAYLILTKLGLETYEAFVIAAFGTAGTIPTMVFFLNFLVPSLTYSAIIIFLLEAAAVAYVYIKSTDRKPIGKTNSEGAEQ